LAVKNHITDPATKNSAQVDATTGEDQALVVATRPLKTFLNKIEFFTNSDYGINMNQNAAIAGTPEHVHDGIDNVYWTGSAIVGGKTTFNSADQNHTAGGSQSVKTDNPDVNDVYQFDRGSNLDLSGYLSLTIWIYVDKDWKAGDSIEIYGWDTGTASQVGNAVALEDYFTWGIFDVWQNISIPLFDMSLTGTIDALRVKQISTEGKAPKYYLDDIQFEERTETGNLITFTVEPAKNKWLHVHGFTVIIADNDYDSTGTGTETMPAIPYDSLLGETLEKGILFQVVTNKEVIFAILLRQLSDLMQIPGTTFGSYGSAVDGTDTWVTINVTFTQPTILKSEHLDHLNAIVAEDLSGLDILRIAATCSEEDRSNS